MKVNYKITMKVLFLTFSVFLVVNGLTDQEQWNNYKHGYGKSYNNIVEEKLRFQIFKDNVKRIEEHNEKFQNGESSYTMGINKFADLTAKEFKETLLSQVPIKPNVEADTHKFPEHLTVAESFDWRQNGGILGVRDQGACGSCWAFSAIESIESHNKIQNNVSVPLSPQQLVDCTQTDTYGNYGCGGGWPISSFDYIKKDGIEAESSYPYKGVNGNCKTPGKDNYVLKLKGYTKVEQSNEEALKNAIGSVGPVSVLLYADLLQLYTSGIFDDKSCPSNEDYLDHAVLAVGYGSDEKINKDFWIVQNSWGANWGEGGYFRIQRNNSLCGILLNMVYPIIKT